MLDMYLLSVILFFVLIVVWLYKDRKNMEIKNYILFMRRTKKFSKMINNIAQKSPKFWKILATIGIIVCFYYMIFGTYMITYGAYKIGMSEITDSTLRMVLPSPFSNGSSSSFHFGIPFWFWIVIIAAILIPHELSHGIISRAEKIRLKSVGVFVLFLSPIAIIIAIIYGLLYGALTTGLIASALLLVLPGAFVEPDDKQLKKAKLLPKLRVFAAGSAANILFAYLLLLLMIFMIWPMSVAPGVELIHVNASSPAMIAGLETGMILTQVNGNQIKSTYKEYINGTSYLIDELGETKINQTITFSTESNDYTMTTSEHNGNPFIGIIYKPVFKLGSQAMSNLLYLIHLIFSLSIAVAIFNILPLYPLDGGLMVEAIADKYMKKHSKKIVKTISMLVVLIILYNFFGAFI